MEFSATLLINRIKTLCDLKDLQKLGISPQLVSNWKSRNSIPKADDLYKIAIAILEEAKDDKDLHKIISDFVSATAEMTGQEMDGDDVVDMFVKKSIENGIDIIRIFDALNDIRNMEKCYLENSLLQIY